MFFCSLPPGNVNVVKIRFLPGSICVSGSKAEKNRKFGTWYGEPAPEWSACVLDFGPQFLPRRADAGLQVTPGGFLGPLFLFLLFVGN